MLSSGADGVPLRGNTDGREVKSMSIGTEKDSYGGNIGMSVVLYMRSSFPTPVAFHWV